MSRARRERIVTVGPTTGLALAGEIDETFAKETLAGINGGFLVLDLGGIRRITSYGVREWIRALSPVTAALKTYFVNVSSPMMDQFNMVQGFDCGGHLLTFRAIFVCDRCGEDSHALIDVGLDRASIDTLRPPARQCEICGELARLDDDPALLFEYARSISPPMIDREVSAFFRGEHGFAELPPGSRIRVVKKVETDTTVFSFAGLVDHAFPVRSILQGSEGRVLLDLEATRGFLDGGALRWREMMTGLRGASCAIVLRAAPPAMLRVFCDEPDLIAGVCLESVAVPIAMEEDAKQYAEVAAISELDAMLLRQSPDAAATRRVRGDPTFIKDLAVRAMRLTSAPPSHQSEQPTFQRAERSNNEEQRKWRVLTFDPVSGESPPRSDPAVPATGLQPHAAAGANYEVVCRLARGGMAEVFLARYHSAAGFRRLALLKRLLPEHTTDSRMMRMFIDEARLAARLDHPNIVSIFDLGKAEGAYFIAMEYVHGRDLHNVVATVKLGAKVMPVGLALSIVADICSALSRAHRPDGGGRCLVHGDVTPRNVLISFDGVVKLVDFGLVRLSSERSTTASGEVSGTPGYLAPECLDGAVPGAAADIWATGVTLFSLLTGSKPFTATTPTGIIAAILREPPMRPTALRPDLPPECDALVRRALAKDPAERFLTAAAFEEAVRTLMRHLRVDPDRRTIAEFMHELFAEQLRRESEFVAAQSHANITDALLFAPGEEVSAFLTAVWPHEEQMTEEQTGPTTPLSQLS